MDSSRLLALRNQQCLYSPCGNTAVPGNFDILQTLSSGVVLTANGNGGVFGSIPFRYDPGAGPGGTTSTPGSNATVSTGSGGGGGGNGSPGSGGSNGGSGIIILRYAGATRGSGGNVITANGFTYHVFTTTGTYTA